MISNPFNWTAGPFLTLYLSFAVIVFLLGAAWTIGALNALEEVEGFDAREVDVIVGTYGADTARWFMLSDSPPERDVQWTEAGIEGASRFQQRQHFAMDRFCRGIRDLGEVR